MKIQITRNGETKEIEVMNPKGRHQREYVKMFSKVSSEDPEAIQQFLDWRYGLIISLCTEFKTKEELEELDMDDLNKIIFAIEGKFRLAGDFEKK